MRVTAKPNRSLFLADDGGQTPALWRNLDWQRNYVCTLFIFDDYLAKSFLFYSSIQDTCAYPEGGGSGVQTPTPSNDKGLLLHLLLPIKCRAHSGVLSHCLDLSGPS